MENQRDRNKLDEENGNVGLVGNGMTPVTRSFIQATCDRTGTCRDMCMTSSKCVLQQVTNPEP